MSDAIEVSPKKRGSFALPLVMLLLGVALGVGLDRAWIGFAPAMRGKPKIVGQWVGISSNEPIEFNADGSYAWEIPVFDMSGSGSTGATGARMVTQ